MNVRGNDGRQLNAACSIKKEDGCFGLVLESWGPSRRNSDYNEALEIIIERLQGKGVKCIIPYIASAPLRKNIPEIGGEGYVRLVILILILSLLIIFVMNCVKCNVISVILSDVEHLQGIELSEY